MIVLPSLVHLFSLLLVAFIHPLPAQSQQLVLNITDTADQTRAGVWIKCKEGCAPKRSDANGTAVLALMPENLASGWVELQVIKRAATDPDWVLLSPWDGKWPTSKRSLTLVVALKGDKQMLHDPKFQELMAARILKQASSQLDRQISEEERRMVLKLQADAVGRTPEEVDQAIRELGERSKDPYQQGLAALYEKNYPKSTALLTQSYEMQDAILKKEQSKMFEVAFFLGQSLFEQGKYRDSAEKYQKAVEQRKDDRVTLNNLGLSLTMAGAYVEAEPVYKRALTIAEEELGLNHNEVATTLNNLAVLYRGQGRYTEAEPLYKRSLVILENKFGPDHSAVASTLNNLASLHLAQGKYAEAEPLYKRSLTIKENVLRPEDPAIGTALNNLAWVYRAQRKYAEAEPLCDRSLAIIGKALGLEHPSLSATLNNLAMLYEAQGRYAEAESAYKRSLIIVEKALGSEHPSVAATLNGLAGLYRAQGRCAEAETLYARALRIFEETLGLQHPNVAIVLEDYAICLRKLNREDEAKRLEERATSIKAKRAGQK